MLHKIKNLSGRLNAVVLVVRYADGTHAESVELPVDIVLEPGDLLELSLQKLSEGQRASNKDAIRDRVRDGLRGDGKENYYGKRR